MEGVEDIRDVTAHGRCAGTVDDGAALDHLIEHDQRPPATMRVWPVIQLPAALAR